MALNHGYLWLVIIAILASLVGVYYYFKIIIAMFTRNSTDSTAIPLSLLQKSLLVLLMLIIITIGWNGWVFNLI
jgi:NADH-quinone oxidoreductase subunit N